MINVYVTTVIPMPSGVSLTNSQMVAMDGEMQVTKDIKLKDIACGNFGAWDEHIRRHAEMIQSLIDAIGSVEIVSWYRTPEDNRAKDGASNSLHLRGLATDIRCDSDPTDAWREVCRKFKAVGGCYAHEDYYHLSSREDQFGHRSFVSAQVLSFVAE